MKDLVAFFCSCCFGISLVALACYFERPLEAGERAFPYTPIVARPQCSPGVALLVADECEHSKALEPILRDVCRRAGVTFNVVNVENSRIVEIFNVVGTPTIIFGLHRESIKADIPLENSRVLGLAPADVIDRHLKDTIESARRRNEGK